ncbi:MAG: hypothetical protein JWM19_3447 [Actinomycetia bacterium]|nr:hypothetical protein [Actinomycetes bacterium]
MSQNSNAALESGEEAAADSPATHRESPATRLGGAVRRRRRKRPLRRFGIIIPAAGAAAVLVVIITVVSYAVSPNGSGAASMAIALNGLTHSQQMTMLEQERQELVVMDKAANTLSTAASPTKVDPDAVIQAAQQTTTTSSSSSGSSSSGSSSSGTTIPQAPAPDPGTAEQIGYDMLPSFGFNQTTQWSCLEQLWTRESGWRWDAENPDGAYGIPQAFPGSKMESAGADWQTDPTTQIKWGLTYITDTYGTPCGAWAEEVSAGGY